MNQEEFINIKEFAQRAGVSQQAVYDRLKKPNNKIQAFVKVLDNKKMLSIKALSLFNSSELEQAEQATLSQKDEIITLLKERVEDQKKQIDKLQEENSRLTKIVDQGQQLQFKLMLPGSQQTTQQPEEPGAAAPPIEVAEVIPESTTKVQHPIDGGKAKKEKVILKSDPQPMNWWVVVVIVAMVAVIVGIFYYLYGYVF